MRTPGAFVVAFGLLVAGSAAGAGEGGLPSGPQAGSPLPGPFNPLNVTNAEMPDAAGKKSDYVEQHGQDPVVLVFAREVSEPLTALIKKLDTEVAKNRSAKLRAVVVVLSEDDEAESKLKMFGEKEGVKNVSLALMSPDRLKHYKLSEAADSTVVLYKRLKVEANHAFRKGELNEKAVGAILADLPKIVSRPR
jgi:hypothetical protein